MMEKCIIIILMEQKYVQKTKQQQVTNIHHGSGTITSYATQTFVKYPDNIEENSIGEIIQIHEENSNASVELTFDKYSYTLTPEQEAAVGSLVTGYYWLASPCVDCSSGDASFSVRFMGDGYISYDDLFYSCGYAYYHSYGVRAVVSVSGL